MGTYFADFMPVPFVMKLSLWRSSWLYIVLALPCIVQLFIMCWNKTLTNRFVIVSTFVLLTGYWPNISLGFLALFNIYLFCFLYQKVFSKRLSGLSRFIPFAFWMVFITVLMYNKFSGRGIREPVFLFSGICFFIVMINILEKYTPAIKQTQLLIGGAIVFILIFDSIILMRQGGPEIYYHGFVKGEKDPWADIQLAAKSYSNKDDLFIVPPYLNNFGIYSKRAVLGDWAEGSSILYQDNSFAKEWLSRMRDLGWKKREEMVSGYNSLSTNEITVVAEKYNAPYVITEKPKAFDLPLVYENNKYNLYTVPFESK
jgi:hypothetical protein